MTVAFPTPPDEPSRYDTTITTETTRSSALRDTYYLLEPGNLEEYEYVQLAVVSSYPP
jgi:hypothetical protein